MRCSRRTRSAGAVEGPSWELQPESGAWPRKSPGCGDACCWVRVGSDLDGVRKTVVMTHDLRRMCGMVRLSVKPCVDRLRRGQRPMLRARRRPQRRRRYRTRRMHSRRRHHRTRLRRGPSAAAHSGDPTKAPTPGPTPMVRTPRGRRQTSHSARRQDRCLRPRRRCGIRLGDEAMLGAGLIFYASCASWIAVCSSLAVVEAIPHRRISACGWFCRRFVEGILDRCLRRKTRRS